MSRGWCTGSRLLWGWALCFHAASSFGAAGQPVTQEQLRDLQRQNEFLQDQVRKQQQLIDNLTRKVSALEDHDRATTTPEAEAAETSRKSGVGFALGRLNFSGEGGVAIFRSESGGPAPNAEFRIDEAKLFVEAPLWKDVYFFTELNITTREDPNIYLQAGELYVDFENLSRFWNRDGQVNLRIGRMDIPFGEEYLTRDAIDNPLISHSLSDIWGIDEGVELYGRIAGVQYVAAVQNGSHPALRDYDVDKSIAVRLAYDPVHWLHVSGSAMRTGAIAQQGDRFAELWFGDDFIHSLAPATATRFEANLLEAGVHARWKRGHLKGAGGYLKYDDDDSTANNQREVYYYYLEGLQHITEKLYAAARWSQILAPHGYPVVGDGDEDEYSSEELTENMWRLSMGLGYRFSPNLLFKAEYTFNEGKTTTGEKRTHENIVSGEVAFRF